MDDYKKITIESYEKTIEEYNENYGKFVPYDEPTRFMSYLKKEALILDIGCGPAKDAKVFVENGFKVIGFDLSEKMVELARKNVPGARFRVMDMLDLDFEDNGFDGVWARCCFLHLKKKEIPKALEEAYRVLKKGGVIHVGIKEGEGERFVSDERYGGVQKFYSFFHKEELETMLKDAGFTIVESLRHSHDPKHDTHIIIDIICRKD